MNKQSLLRYSALLLAACAFVAVPAMAQMTSTGLSCQQIQSLNLLKQDNMRAGLTLIECGIVEGGKANGGIGDISKRLRLPTSWLATVAAPTRKTAPRAKTWCGRRAAP